MHYVYVLDPSGNPLMPTTRYGKVRQSECPVQECRACVCSVTDSLPVHPAT